VPSSSTRRLPSPATVISLLALFVALGGPAAAANGAAFILGQANSATAPTRLTSSVASAPALTITDTGGKPAARFVTDAGVAPFLVSNGTKVVKLNADKLDDLDSTAFVRPLVSVAVSSASSGVDVLNTGSGNAISGRTNSTDRSGVYGEALETGYGVAGRALYGGAAVYGDAGGGGMAGLFNGNVHVNGTLTPDIVSCSGCITKADLAGSYITGVGQANGIAYAVPAGNNLYVGVIASMIQIGYNCPGPDPTTTNGDLYIDNVTTGTLNLFVDSGGANPTYDRLTAGVFVTRTALAAGDSWTIQVQGAGGVLVIHVATANRATDCHVQAQGLLTN
jgi:hypothetical protein